jgi:hypothetical protein
LDTHAFPAIPLNAPENGASGSICTSASGRRRKKQHQNQVKNCKKYSKVHECLSVLMLYSVLLKKL